MTYANERSQEQWEQIFVTQTDGSPEQIARRIIADLWGYATSSKRAKSGPTPGTDGDYRKGDIKSLANALEAFAANYPV